MKRIAILGVLWLFLGVGIALVPIDASAGVATSDAVLLDPFDPVPEIQFQHYGGYGCVHECWRGSDRCDDGCFYRSHHHHHRCDDGCYRRDHCGRDCGWADRARYVAPPCASGHCSDDEHYEHQWRDGDHVGQDYFDRGHRERDLRDGAGPPTFDGHGPRPHDGDDDDGGHDGRPH